MRGDKRTSIKSETKGTVRGHKRGVVGYSRKTALLEEAITQMNAGKYGRSSSALKELLALDPQNMEARRLFATLHLRLGSLIPARQAFDTLITEALQRQDYWLAESLLREYLAAGPRCVPFLEKLGVIHEEKGDVQEAVAEYGKAIDILIEDPDPDHPRLVSQLYKKVRDLAPASPIAIRLASFFDAQTGDLIARGPNPAKSVAEPLGATTDHHAIPELGSGVMPWDIEAPQGELHAAAEVVPQADDSTPSAPAQDREVLSEVVTARGQSEQSAPIQIHVQRDRSLGEPASAQSAELTHHDGDHGELQGREADLAPVQVSTLDTPAVALSSDLAADAHAGLPEPGVTGVEARPACAQGVVESIQSPGESGLASTTESLAVQHTTSEPSAAGRACTTSPEEAASVTVTHSQIGSIPIPEAVSTASESPAGSDAQGVRDIQAPEVSGDVLLRSPAEPWKEPGFSWKTLFDRAWNFGTLPSAGSPEQDTIRAKREVPSISERIHLDHSSRESESAQIPEREKSAGFLEEVTATGSIKPMPWDQIQESVLPIPPAQVDEPQAEGMGSTEGHVSSTVQKQSQIESAAVEIPERTEGDAVTVELTSTGSIKPMPWDQIQESVLQIPPAQVKESQVEGTGSTEGHVSSTAQERLQVARESVKEPEATDSDVAGAQLTGTAPIGSIVCDGIQESVIHLPLAQVEEPQVEVADVTEGQAVSTAQETSQRESDTVEIPEGVRSATFLEEATSTGSIKPMPWDQIQESVLPIPSVQVEESQAEGTGSAEGQVSATVQEQVQAESASVEIPERTEDDTVAVELTSTGSVSPMPWDQIQDSVIPISPAQVEESQTEGTGSTVQERSQSESTAIESPERRDRNAASELTATVPVTPMLQDQIQESVISTPTASIEELQAGGMPTTEERVPSTVGADEVVDVGQDHSLVSEDLAPASEEIESRTETSAPAIAPPFVRQKSPAQGTDSDPDAPRLETSPEVPFAVSWSDEDRQRSGETGSAVFPARAQTDELDQSFRLRVSDGHDAEQESAVPPSPSSRAIESGPISNAEALQEPLPSGTNRSDSVEATPETVREVSLSLVGERKGDREEGVVVPQAETTEEDTAVSSPSRESSPTVPQWQTPEPVTASPVEREVISAVPGETVSISPSSEMVATVQIQDDRQHDDLRVAESIQQSSESAVHQDEWAKTSGSIRFVAESPEASSVTAEPEQVEVSPAVGMMADDTRFMSSRNVGRDASREQEVEAPSRPKVHSQRRGMGVAIQDFIGSCFSTTRAIVATGVGLMLLSVMAVALGIGMVGLAWMSMEEGPSPAYQRLTTIPQQTLSDFRKNGYFLLMGFDAPAQLDPIQAGHDGKTGADHVGMGRACLGDAQGPSGQQPNASASVSKSWFRSADPVGQVKSHSDTVRGWANQQTSALSRYGRWHTLPFEDWGYGQTGGLPCASIAFAHELYLADGFLQAMEEGVERLETDMEAWRIVLGQARTLPVKTLALEAMNDDIAVASGLLVRPDFDGKYLGRLSKMLRPLDQAELSIRWPMQSELVVASKAYEAQVKAAKTGDQSLYAVIASMLSLPKQRRLNDYAEYYEASYKAVEEGHHSTLPKRKDYIRTPASGLSDYMANPIENIVGLEALPPWDLYHGQVMDTEARLRLASLQAWLRRGPTDGDVLTRLAKAGQKFYDPYTGLPMLVNMKKAALYSVGHDGKDQDADPQFDVVVTLPAVQSLSVQSSSKSSAEPSKP